MAETTQQAITTEWQKVSESDCTIQSVRIDVFYNVSVGATAPTDNYLTLKVAEPVTFAYKSPVWMRLHHSDSPVSSVDIVIIK